MKRHLLVVAILCCTAVAVCAQVSKLFSPADIPETVGFSAERLKRIDKMIDEHLSKNIVPGAVVLITRNGKIVLHKAYGYSDLENKTAQKKDDIFRIASQSKAITSLAVMMLWEEGKFLLDDPISRYIPEFKDQKVLKSYNPRDSSYTTEPAKSEITIRQLLTHTSGLDYASIGSDNFTAIYAKAGVTSGIGNANAVLGDKMKILATLPLKHQPGEQWTYGLNTDMLGYLVEVLSGMSFDEFLRKRIFGPLGMKDTYFYLPPEKYSRLVPLYTTDNGVLKKVTGAVFDHNNSNYPTSPGKYYSGGAGLSSTVMDYAIFLQLFLNGGQYNGVRLLSRKTVELMLTNQLEKINDNFGLGFALETGTNDYLSPFSLGSFSWGGAFNTQYWADPKEKLIGVIYTNIYKTTSGGIGDKFKVMTYQSIID